MSHAFFFLALWLRIFGFFSSDTDDPPAAQEDLTETQSPADMSGLCRKYRLRSRYCREFRLPDLSFDRLEKAFRQKRGALIRENRSRTAQARAAGWLPDVALEWGQVGLQETASNWQTGQDFQNRLNQEYRNFWKIRASWNLRTLVQDPRALERERQLQQQLENMQKQLDRARRIYYQWFHEVLEHRRNPSILRLLRCEELEASLNSLTSGAFSTILGPGT